MARKISPPPDSARREDAEAGLISARRKLATDCFRLHLICGDPSCRRARACVGEGAQCLIRCKQVYQHLLPELRAALKRRMDG